jgi:hypothetical protein
MHLDPTIFVCGQLAMSGATALRLSEGAMLAENGSMLSHCKLIAQEREATLKAQST